MSSLESAGSMRFLPPKLAESLFEFQKRGIEYGISKNGRCLIGDDMGLGKTLQALSIAYYYKNEWPLLIVSPSSLKYSWIEEIEKWLPEIPPQKIHIVRGANDILPFASSLVTVMSIGLFSLRKGQVLLDGLKKQKFQVVIVDESHCIKSKYSNRTKNIENVLRAAKRVIMLSGTPAISRPSELFSQINVLAPKVFPNFFAFARRYCEAQWNQYGRLDIRGASHLEELHRKLSKHVLIRRMKTQVLDELPAKLRQKVVFEVPPEKITGIQTDFDSLKEIVENADEDPRYKARKLVLEMYQKTGEIKIPGVVEYIKVLLKNADIKFLVFAHHLKVQRAIAAQLVKLGVKFVRIYGEVVPRLRHDLVKQFQEDPKTTVALLSLKAANTGLHLTAATHVVFAELYYNPGELIQAEDRCHRIGQRQNTHVHYLIARGTLDDVMWTSLSTKVAMTTHVLNGKVEMMRAENNDDRDLRSLLEACFHYWVGDPQTSATHDDQSIDALIRKAKRDQKAVKLDSVSNLDLEELSSDSSDAENLLSSEPRVVRRRKKSKEKFAVPFDDSDDDFEPQRKRLKPRQESNLPSPLQSDDDDDDDDDFASSFLSADDVAGEDEAPAIEIDDDNDFESDLIETMDKILQREDESSRILAEAGLDKQLLEEVFACDDVEFSSTQNVCEGTAKFFPTHDIRLPDDIPFYSKPLLPAADDSSGKLKFFISVYTERFHIYNENDEFYHCNVALSEILSGHRPEKLPEILFSSSNFQAAYRFVRKYQKLSVRDKVLVRNAREITADVRTTLAGVKQRTRDKKFTRYLNKEAFNETAVFDAAQAAGGEIRIVQNPITLQPIGTKSGKGRVKRQNDASRKKDFMYLQAVLPDGKVVCAACMKSFKVDDSATVPYGGRFCSEECYTDYRLKTGKSKARRLLREEEKGICDVCQVDTEDLRMKLRSLENAADRLDVLMKTGRFGELSENCLKGIITTPIAGKLWHADHIVPVSRGGGACSRNNLRILCVPCHQRVTKELLAKKKD